MKTFKSFIKGVKKHFSYNEYTPILFSSLSLIVAVVISWHYAPTGQVPLTLSNYVSNHLSYITMCFLAIIVLPMMTYMLTTLAQELVRMRVTTLAVAKKIIHTTNTLKNDLSLSIIEGVNTKLPENFRDALKYYYEPGEIASFRKDIHSVMNELFNPKSEELMVPIRKFIYESIGAIMHRGFVQISSPFPEYRRQSNEMVKRLYQSSSENNVWMVCLYNPLSWLAMTVLKTAKKDKPDHLILFNGSDPDNDYNFIDKTPTTDTIRIAYLKKNDLEYVFSDHLNEYTEESKKDKLVFLGDLYLFSYLFFIFFNTEINLLWRWYDFYHDGDIPNGMKNGDEDFMIFKKHYLWRYNIPKEILSICWKWDKLSGSGDELMKAGIELFENKIAREENFHKSMLQMISEHYRSNHIDFLQKVKKSFSDLQNRINEKASGMVGVEKEYFELISSVIQPTLEKFDLDCWDSDDVEKNIISLFKVDSEKRKNIYKYLFSSRFEATMKDIFPEICSPTMEHFQSGLTYSEKIK